MTTESEKRAARNAVNRAVASGRLLPKPCEKCGGTPAQGHHPDYTAPLDVVWLCASCHSQLHNQKHPLTKTCVACGTEFTPHPTKSARALTCSTNCRARAISRTKAQDPNPTRPTWTKLTVESAARLRERRAEGATVPDLIGEFGVTRSTVNAVLRGAIWADAPMKACVGAIMADAVAKPRATKPAEAAKAAA